MKIFYFLLLGILFFGCEDLMRPKPNRIPPPPLPPPCDPLKQNCSGGTFDSSEYFTITNRLPSDPSQTVKIDAAGIKEVELPSGQCARIHHSLYKKVNVSLRKDGKYLKICRPNTDHETYSRYRSPEKGTQRFTCNHGIGFIGDILNYKIENTDNLMVNTSSSPVCPVVVKPSKEAG